MRGMTYFDVFNGDADGICALHQLRLSNPRESLLITGVKRDIALLKQVQASSQDEVVVLDISLDKNRDALSDVLEAGAQVYYFDHHFAGDIPVENHLYAYINTASNTCTSLLVNKFLGGEYLAWAVTAAFGDNLFEAARIAAKPLQMQDNQIEQLKDLGTLMNYNGYGVSVDDLHVHPADLYRAVQPYATPFDFIHQSNVYTILAQGYAEDMACAEQELQIETGTKNTAWVILPDQAWARRISGIYANRLAREFPYRAHALLTVLDDDFYRVSVRAPLENKQGADELCMQFPTGGGRKAAAGINALPVDKLDDFIAAFYQQYQ